MALEDIHPDCGPFEFVPGSHRWPTLRQEKVRSLLPPLYARAQRNQHDYGHWAWSQDFVSAAMDHQIENTGLKPELGKKGTCSCGMPASLTAAASRGCPELGVERSSRITPRSLTASTSIAIGSWSTRAAASIRTSVSRSTRGDLPILPRKKLRERPAYRDL